MPIREFGKSIKNTVLSRKNVIIGGGAGLGVAVLGGGILAPFVGLGLTFGLEKRRLRKRKN